MAKVFLCGAGVAAALVCGGAGCQTKTKSIPPATKTWNDPAIGLTFRYPTVWTTNPKHQSYMRPMTLQPDQKPIVDAQFTGVGNLYGKTNLSELDFVYSTRPADSAAACYKAGNIGDDPTKSSLQTIRGVAYSHSSGSDGGMCHEISSHAFATFRGGTCHIFEEAFMTLCPGVVEGTRGLTTSETKALQGHLDAIMQSVAFAPAPATGQAKPQP